MDTPRFQRTGGRKVTATKDETGSVVVRFLLLRGSKYATGNISRCFTVRNAKVSEVHDAVERFLFGDPDA